MLKWLYAQLCPCGETTCLNAAENGHLTTLQWLRSQVLPWGDVIKWDKAKCLKKAEENGHTATAAWIQEQPE